MHTGHPWVAKAMINASGYGKENVRTEQMMAAKRKNYIKGSKKGNWEGKILWKYSTHK